MAHKADVLHLSPGIGKTGNGTQPQFGPMISFALGKGLHIQRAFAFPAASPSIGDYKSKLHLSVTADQSPVLCKDLRVSASRAGNAH